MYLFIDMNIFLSFYHYTNDNLEGLRERTRWHKAPARQGGAQHRRAGARARVDHRAEDDDGIGGLALILEAVGVQQRRARDKAAQTCRGQLTTSAVGYRTSRRSYTPGARCR